MLIETSLSVLTAFLVVGLFGGTAYSLDTQYVMDYFSALPFSRDHIWISSASILLLVTASGVGVYFIFRSRQEEEEEDFEDELDRMIRQQKEKSEKQQSSVSPSMSRTGSLDEIIVARTPDVIFSVSEELVKEYPFYELDNEKNICYEEENGKTQLQAATFYKLVEKVTHHSKQDPRYVRAFLLTYRSFSCPTDLLEALKLRWKLPRPDLKEDEVKSFDSLVKQVRLRIWYVMKQWLESFYEFDFKGDEELIESFTEFAENDMLNTLGAPAKQLMITLKRKETGSIIVKKIQTKLPDPIIPKKTITSIMDIHPVEVARQLSLIEHQLYCNIQPKECLDQSWTKKDTSRAPNVLALIDRFNMMSRWVITMVVQEPNLKKRIRLVNHLIQIALECKKIANFNGMMEIVSGLLNAPVSRLKKTWAGLPKRSQSQFKKFEYIMARNYKLLRDYIQYSNPPVLPYIGIYMGDLTFIHEGNANTTAEGLINFYKRNLISRVILQIQQHQRKPFCYEAVESIRSFMNESRELLDDNAAYKLSLQIEPRQKSS